MPRKAIFTESDLRQRMEARAGKRYWQSLQELAETPEVRQAIEREFPEGASEWPQESSRRQFLKLMSASLALAGLSAGCERPSEKILPYVEAPEDIVPGKPMYFATAMPVGGYGVGLVVESHMGRPTKIEGNRLHPASLGATDALAQASILGLYDPDRSQAIKNGRTLASEQVFQRQFEQVLAGHRIDGGRRLRVLSSAITSPTLARQRETWQQTYPEANWHFYEPVMRDHEQTGAEDAFGESTHAVHHLDRADVVLSLDADFLNSSAWPIPYARHFTQRRSDAAKAVSEWEMPRLYVVESTPSITGSKADHRLSLAPQHILAVLHQIAVRLGIRLDGEVTLPAGVSSAWVDAVVEDLRDHRVSRGDGGALILLGASMPAEAHSLVHLLHERLGGVGVTVTYHEPPTISEPHLASLDALVSEIRNGDIDSLIILQGNPAFDAPVEAQFAGAVRQLDFSIHLSLYENETSRSCRWHLPARHFLETWSDVRAFDGTASIVQPLIAPLYNGWSEHRLLSVMNGSTKSDYELVRETWSASTENDDDSAWEQVLRVGVVPETRSPSREVRVAAEQVLTRWSDLIRSAAGSPTPEVQVLFRADPSIWDGRYANNGWLQELPKPLSKLTWDNAALVSPPTAQRLELSEGDLVRLDSGEHHVELPIFILPGQPDGCITLHLGYGRTAAGRVGDGVGFDVYPLRRSQTPWQATATLEKTGERYRLATTQKHHLMEGRHLVQHGTLHEWKEDPEHPSFMHHAHVPDASLLPEWEYNSYKWGMSIDLTRCTGCNACVVACQAENNIPVVGKEQVAKGREMHWLRIDSYYSGEDENLETYHQPVACQHCEKAPCEVVCPVAATTHSDEGLNEMTYNRCVGTRYCSNNCPYKVRRFNFLQYSDYETPVFELLRNPDVTVRTRGVMEKCTYCVQRINSARIESDKENRRIRADEVETACQAVCPTQAISFGDLNNADSQVVHWKEQPIDYGLLEEINVAPRTSYLANMTNPNPKLHHPPPDSH